MLDTNSFSDVMNDHPKLRARLLLASLADAGVIICSIVRGEIIYGIERLPQGRRREELERKANRVFASAGCEPVPEEAGDHYARLKTARQQRGLTMAENDLWIAATALALDATLVSRDSDFEQIDGLTVVDWTV